MARRVHLRTDLDAEWSMNESLPITGDSAANAYAAFVEWQRRHPDLATKFPATLVDFIMRDRRRRSQIASHGA
jgi:hypothetical protein